MSRFPDQSAPRASVPPMVYVADKTVWQYKQITRDLSQDGMPAEDDLNQLGKDGWELVSILNHAGSLFLYFKRMKP
jgi:hypothetical protein